MNITLISLIISNVYTNSPMLNGNNIIIKKSLFSHLLTPLLFNPNVFNLYSCKFYKLQNTIIDKNNEFLSFYPFHNLQLSKNQELQNETITQPTDIGISDCLVIHDCTFSDITLYGDNNVNSPIQITGKKPFYMTNCLFKRIKGTKTALHLSIRAATLDHICMFDCRSSENKEFFALDLDDNSFCKFIFSTFVGGNDESHGNAAFEFQHGYNQFNCLNFSNIKESNFIFRIDDPKCFIFSMNTIENIISEENIFFMSISEYSYSYLTNNNIISNTYGSSLFCYNRNDVFSKNTYFTDCCFKNNKLKNADSNSNIFIYVGSAKYKIYFSHCYFDVKPDNDKEYLEFTDCDQEIPLNKNDHFATDACDGILAIKAFGCADNKCPENNNCNSSIFDFGSNDTTYTLIPHPDINTPTFSPTQAFSKTEVFSETGKFTRSSMFSETGKFTKSSVFYETEKFTRSSMFSESGKFTKSSVFYETGKFTRSSMFSETDEFSNSALFSETGKFSKSSLFSETNFFSQSVDFTKSTEFSNTKGFLPTKQFSNSAFFSETNGFSKTDYFSETTYFTKSSLFSETAYFSQSTQFSSSFYFSNSDKFSKTSGFSTSIYFTESTDFSESHDFTTSQYFSNSIMFTKSNAFIPSYAFTNSQKFTLSTYFTKSGYFSQSTRFSESNDFTVSTVFTRSSYFTQSDDWNRTYTFSPSSVFSKSSYFSSSFYFTNSKEFTKTDGFTKTEHFTGTKHFSDSHSFSYSISFSDSHAFTASIIPSKNDSVIIIEIKQEKTSKSNTGMKIGIGVGAGVLGLVALLAGIILLIRKKRGGIEDLDDQQIELFEDETNSIVTQNPLMTLMDEDDPFENEFN